VIVFRKQDGSDGYYYQDATQNFVVLEVKPPHTAKPAEIIMWVSETLRPPVL
jgi:hypothetical protein